MEGLTGRAISGDSRSTDGNKSGRNYNISKRFVPLILGLAGFVVMVDNWVVSPLLPAIAGRPGVDPTRAGVVISAYMISFGIFRVIFPLADRYGKRQVISTAMFIFAVATS